MSDMVAKVEWMNEYLKERGYKVKEPIIYCDNTSTITIVKKETCKPLRNRHMIARRSILHEVIVEEKHMILKWKSTKVMIANIMTKALGGELFENFACAIMGWSK